MNLIINEMRSNLTIGNASNRMLIDVLGCQLQNLKQTIA